MSEDCVLCHVCGLELRIGADTQCGHCLQANYCSSECQARDWDEGGHSRQCYDAHEVRAELLAHEIASDIHHRMEDHGEEEIVEAQAIIGALMDPDHRLEHIVAAHEWLAECRIGGSVAPHVAEATDEELVDLLCDFIEDDHLNYEITGDHIEEALALEEGEALSEDTRVALRQTLVQADFADRVHHVAEDSEWWDRVDDNIDGVISNLRDRYHRWSEAKQRESAAYADLADAKGVKAQNRLFFKERGFKQAGRSLRKALRGGQRVVVGPRRTDYTVPIVDGPKIVSPSY